MSSPDGSWTITPTLVWFGAVLVTGLVLIDGDLHAVADRLTVHRPHGGAAVGPAIVASAQVADVDTDTDVDTEATSDAGGGGPKSAAVGSGSAAGEGREKIGALEDTCLDGAPASCKHWAMDGFYQALADEQAGKLGRPVRVSWYGDSVVATDAIPGHLRARLQETFGDGGPGFVYAIAPHRYCDHEAITRSFDGEWRPYAISTTQVPDGLYGPAGSTAEVEGGGTATIKVTSGKVTNVELYYLAQPHGGTAKLVGDGTELVKAETAADAKQPGWATASAPSGMKKLEIETHGRVRVFGADLENATGAVVDNLGIVSVNVKSFGANQPAHWTAELAHRHADMVMIMIGANEAEWLSPGDKDTKDYQAHYEQVLAPIRKGVPDAACLVVSPTDQAEAFEGDFRSRPVMPLLVDAQRKAARAQGCAFYSTYDWMGGRGSSVKWFKKKLVSSDFQHLSKAGANKMADAVYDALMTGSKKYAHE